MPDLIIARALHGAVTTAKGTFVFGGNGEDQKPIADAECFLGEWGLLPDMPTATSAVVAIEKYDLIYITGQSINGIEEYNPETRCYRQLYISQYKEESFKHIFASQFLLYYMDAALKVTIEIDFDGAE